ncbi:PTS system mannose/fructose/sorbose family transporter subunit IID [Streptococcus equi subsp. zooepidemicus]|nr:PTS system mannose/fructose/sorbose family transporter subunit IID [Streptococcus equi subsp. zooepidemicus]
MMGPLAGIGDPVFWFTVRPILGALGASLHKLVTLSVHSFSSLAGNISVWLLVVHSRIWLQGWI